jgi:hypothetical protein
VTTNLHNDEKNLKWNALSPRPKSNYHDYNFKLAKKNNLITINHIKNVKSNLESLER